MRRLLPLALILGPLVLMLPALLPGRAFVPIHTSLFEPLRSWEDDSYIHKLIGGSDPRWNHDAVDKLFPIYSDAVTAREDGLLWSPRCCGGAPVLAQGLAGLLYPPNLIMQWVDPIDAYPWLALLSLALAGWLAWLFLRDLGLGGWACLIGAATYALALYSTASLHYYMRVDSAIWLPAALLAVRRSARGGTLAPAGLALSLGLSYLAGFPQMTFLIAYACGIYALILVPDVARREGKRGAAIFLGGKVVLMAAGLLVAAAQALPQSESSEQSLRSASQVIDPRVTSEHVDSWRAGAMPPAALATVFAPYLLGSPTSALFTDDPMPALLLAEPYRDNPASPGSYIFTEHQLYVGILPLLLALVALVACPRRSWGPLVAWAACVAFACAPLPAGALGEPLRALYSLPFIQVGAPMRIIALAVFFLAWAAALGAERLRTERLRAVLPAAGLLLLATLGYGVFLGQLSRPRFQEFVARGLEEKREQADPLVERFLPRLSLDERELAVDGKLSALELDRVYRRVRGDALRGVLVCSFAALALIVWLLVGARRIAAALLFLLVLADLVLVGRIPNEPQPRHHLLARPPPVRVLQELVAADGPAPHRIARAARSFHDMEQLLRPTLPALYGIPDLSGYIVVASRRLAELFQAFDPQSVYSRWFAYLPIGAERPSSSPDWLDHAFLDLAGVGWILAREDLHALPGQDLRDELERVDVARPPGRAPDREPHFRIYRRKAALPRAFLVPRLVVGSDEKELAGILGDPGFDPRETMAVLASDLPTEVDADREGHGAATLRIASYEPARVRLEKAPGDAGWAYLSDVFWPGWKARVDGEERPIVAANYAFRGVWMGAGERVLEMVYEPVSVRTGIYLSALALLSLLPLALLERFLRRAAQ